MLAPGLEQLADRLPFAVEQPVHRRPTRGGVLEPPGRRRPASVHRATRSWSRPSSRHARRGDQPWPHGVVDQVEQAGLDARVHPGRDRAGGQSQRDFPSCRCSATACSVTVARSRSISASGPRPAPARFRTHPGPTRRRGRERVQRALLRGPAHRDHRGPVHPVPLGGLPLGGLPGQHRHAQLVLLARRQHPPPLRLPPVSTRSDPTPATTSQSLRHTVSWMGFSKTRCLTNSDAKHDHPAPAGRNQGTQQRKSRTDRRPPHARTTTRQALGNEITKPLTRNHHRWIRVQCGRVLSAVCLDPLGAGAACQGLGRVLSRSFSSR